MRASLLASAAASCQRNLRDMGQAGNLADCGVAVKPLEASMALGMHSAGVDVEVLSRSFALAIGRETVDFRRRR